MNWTEIVVAIVAIYGALLSTYIQVARLRENKSRVRVKISQGFLTAFLPGQTSERMVFLQAANVGKKPVTLSSFFFRLPNKNRVTIPYPIGNITLPYELLPGKSSEILVEPSKFAETLKEEGYSKKVKIIGIYTDQVDNSYKSKPYIFHIND